ncbi:methyltransferase [Bdellovibrio sp. HCB337]|uniref:methyltransferase n=1 Tax=Bdellovibrio sp. HCB337 TaxID=3394358 RepID=UPI0039A5C268
MSSVNPFYTFNYSQPEEYRFSHDSVFLARQVFEAINPDEIASLKGLDLCAGCGIIGLDFIFHCQKELRTSPLSFDFIEVQDIYREHFNRNSQNISADKTSLQFLNINYAELLSEPYQARYDLIVCNPPYFRPGQGKMSPSEFKNRCRFFIDSDFKTLLTAIARALSPKGQAYVLLRSLEDHGFDALQEAREILSGIGHIEPWADIRGTHAVRITRHGTIIPS